MINSNQLTPYAHNHDFHHPYNNYNDNQPHNYNDNQPHNSYYYSSLHNQNVVHNDVLYESAYFDVL